MEISTTSRYCASSSSNPYQTSIPLRRMKSSTSSNYSNPFSVASSKNPFADPETSTIASTNASLLPHTEYESGSGKFVPEKRLEVKTIGKNPISFPSPPKELVITILEGGKERYFSIRPTRKSGSCRLVRVDGEGEERVVGDTTYKFGLRPPSVRVFVPVKPVFPPSPANNNTSIDKKDQLVDISLNNAESFSQATTKVGEEGEEESPEVVDQFEMKGRSLFSRSVEFESRRYGVFRWRYAGRSERLASGVVGPEGHEISNMIVLEKIIPPRSQKGKEKRIQIARLIRGFGLRTEGTGRTWAGNGGMLEINLRPEVDLEENGWDDGGIGDLGRGELLEEECVVSTCLVMLKKEIDRLRAAQICAMTAGGGGC